MRIRLGIPISLQFTAKKTGAVFHTDKNALIEYISTDTRELQRGDLFISLRGRRYDGDSFLNEAAELGAYTMSAKERADIVVSDTEIALLSLACAYIRLLPVKQVIAITGSVGKTTTRELSYSLLKTSFKVHSTDGNLNNTIGVPLTILGAPSDTEILLIEAGMNRFGELRRISNAILPTLSVITNIGSSHLENLKTRGGIAEAKKEIFSGMVSQHKIIPHGEPLLSDLYRAKTLSVDAEGGDYRIFTEKISEEGGEYRFYYGNSDCISLKSRALGAHVASALGYALAISKECGIDDSALSKAELPRELIHTKLMRFGKIKILDDSYNSSLESVRSALISLKLLNAKTRIALLADTLEVGESSEEYHNKIGSLCKEYGVDYLFTFGKQAKSIASGAISAGLSEERVRVLSETYDYEYAASAILPYLTEECALLIKASHATGAYKISGYIKNFYRSSEKK